MTPERLSALTSSIVHDVLRERSDGNHVLPHDLVPVIEGVVAGGFAFPASGGLDPTVSDDQSLLDWTELLSVAPAGSIVVLEANDDTLAHMGELSAEALLRRDVRGFVTDGGTRDVSGIRSHGLPVWSSYRTPSDIVGRWTIQSIGEPITIGDVEIHPGDAVVADDDGIVVIPAALTEDVVTESERMLSTEGLVRAAIREGATAKEAYLRHRKF